MCTSQFSIVILLSDCQVLNKTASDPTSFQPVLTVKRPRDETDANLPEAKMPKEAEQQPAEPSSMVPELLGVICEIMEELAGMEYVVRRELACCLLHCRLWFPGIKLVDPSTK